MSILLTRSDNTALIRINEHKPVVDYGFSGESEKLSTSGLHDEFGFTFTSDNESVTLGKKLGLREHILGLGEKAFNIDKKRMRMDMWNFDQNGYNRGDDPLYLSIPFFISVNKVVTGVFVNSTSRVHFDFGITEHDGITIRIPEPSVDLYVFRGDTVEAVLEEYVKLTGNPMKMPEWGLEPHISRYSYFPQDRVIEVVDEYRKSMPVSAVYLDIDYMDAYKLFTWDSKKFPEPVKLIKDLHERGVKLVTIVDPGIKVEEDYQPFADGLGTYVSTPENEIYTGKLWPGKSAFPDFLSTKGQEYWKKQILEFSKSGVDGIWLDMNEPTILDNKVRTIEDDAVHKELKEKHSRVHNAYAYYQAKATYEAFSSVREEPYILSRAGFAGIQKYSLIWTGDNLSTWDDLSLQISMVCSLGLSGIPFTGCDIGGFMTSSEPELVARYYQMAAFFPLYRNHSDKFSVDQEIYTLPDLYRNMALNGVNLRMKFLPYLKKLAEEAHETGHPVVRPLCYEFFQDENTYSINDEYMVGKDLLFAPIVTKGATGRNVYLPQGKWVSYYSGEELEGSNWYHSDCEMPLYVRCGAEVPVEEGTTLVCSHSNLGGNNSAGRVEIVGSNHGSKHMGEKQIGHN